jgi:predicted SnoaL-like aldol condensation-catalyzing enzyme
LHSRTADRFLGATYAQHGSSPKDGATPLRYPVLPEDPGVRPRYLRVEKVFPSSQFVMIESKGEVAGVPRTFNDLFRVENGRIVERWHAPQRSTIPASAGG